MFQKMPCLDHCSDAVQWLKHGISGDGKVRSTGLPYSIVVQTIRTSQALRRLDTILRAHVHLKKKIYSRAGQIYGNHSSKNNSEERKATTYPLKATRVDEIYSVASYCFAGIYDETWMREYSA